MALTSPGLCSRGKDFIEVLDTARRVKGIVKAGAKDDKKTRTALNSEDKTTTKEKELLESVVNGDISNIRLLFSKGDIPDVYIGDMAGRTPFHLAVDAGNEEIACLILEKYNKNDVIDKALIKRVLMGAISRDQEPIALTVVKHQRYQELFPPTTEHMDGPLKADMFQNIDPIVLASQMNHFNLVEFLCSRGDRIPPPHPPTCQCEGHCKRFYEQDQLLFTKLRLENYRGLSSAAYVSLASLNDPIGEAFSLGKQLREMASIEKHFKKEYTELADNLSEYVYNLLDLIETNHELDKVLNKSDDGASGQLQRIKLAVENGEKNFVAHPCCQQKLTEVWFRDLRTMSDSWRLWLIGVLYLFFSPFIGLYYALRPKSKLAGYISTPFLRFINSLVWYLYFFIIITLMAYHTYVIDAASQTYQEQATDTSSALNKYLRSQNFPTNKGTREESLETMILAGCILCWLIGMIWTQVKSIYELGIVIYSSDPFNVMESVVIILYLTAIVLMFDTQRNLKEKQRLVIKEWSYNTQYDDSDLNQNLAREYWYWVIPDRHYWNNDDPSLVVDAMFAVASILATCKIFYFMAASSIFGPILVALRKILRDVLKFFAFLLIIFMAFMMALQSLFVYFSEGNRRNVETVTPDDNNPVSATKFFGSAAACINTMFWAMFALGDYQAVNIGDGSNPYTNHSFTQRVAYMIFGFYHFVIFFVMLNLFVAIMNETYNDVMKYNDREWKFVRAKLYLDFLTGGTQPSPLNWIPSLKAWFYCCTNRYTAIDYKPPNTCWGTCSYPGNNRVTPGLVKSDNIVKELNPSKRRGDYKKVMYDLIERYRKSNIKKLEDDVMDDVEEIKRKIVNVRRQLEQRIMEHKGTVVGATKVTNTQDLSLSALSNRLLPVENALQAIRNTLQDFITMLKRFNVLKDEMAALEATLKYKDEESEDEEEEEELTFEAIDIKEIKGRAKARKSISLGNDKTSTHQIGLPALTEQPIEAEQTAAGDLHTLAASHQKTAESGDIPAESGDITAESGDMPAKSGDITAESGDIPAESVNITAESWDMPAKSVNMPPVKPAKKANILVKPALYKRTTRAEKRNTPVVTDLEGKDNQPNVAPTESPVDTDATGEPSKAELPERPTTGDVRRKLTSTPSMYDGVGGLPLPPPASEPGDAKFDIESLMAEEQQKALDGTEVLPDYSLPDDDLPLSAAGDLHTLDANETTRKAKPRTKKHSLW